ncbi:MAG: prolyl-tRNA synthetase associated domain-containing protein [Clostridia bacterium]|nr:prolyl-tRNA synthetase associated domain-containing protein [Clostridia bacterium]
MKGEEIFALLDDAGVAYEALRHPAVYTIDGLDALELPKKERIAKNLYLRDDKRRHYYLVVAEQKKRADLKALRRTISSRPLSFASKEETEKLLGVSSGSVSPLGILNDEDRKTKVLIDDFFLGGEIGVHPNENTATLWLKTEDLMEMIRRHGTAVETVVL